MLEENSELIGDALHYGCDMLLGVWQADEAAGKMEVAL